MEQFPNSKEIVVIDDPDEIHAFGHLEEEGNVDWYKSKSKSSIVLTTTVKTNSQISRLLLDVLTLVITVASSVNKFHNIRKSSPYHYNTLLLILNKADSK